MHKTTLAAFATLLIAGAGMVATSTSASAQMVGDANTTITGTPIYVEENSPDLAYGGGHNGLNINGAVGLPLNPTAQLPAVGSGRVQANYYKLWSADVAGSSADAKLYGVYGAMRAGDKMEISAGYEKLSVNATGPGATAIEDTFAKSGIAVGAKYLLTDNTDPLDLQVAIGAGYSKALYNNTHAYLVASKGFATGGDRVVNGHIGLRWDRFKVDSTAITTGSVESSKVSAYAGVEVPIDSKGRFNVVAEVQTKNAQEDLGAKMPYSLSLRFQNKSGFSVNAGIQRQGVLADFTSGSANLFIHAGKSF